MCELVRASENELRSARELGRALGRGDRDADEPVEATSLESLERIEVGGVVARVEGSPRAGLGGQRVPGRDGPGLTEDLPALAARMAGWLPEHVEAGHAVDDEA